MTNIAAYTAPTPSFPAYLSINRVDGDVQVTVRSASRTDGVEGPQAVITIPAEAWEEMQDGLFAR